MVKEKTLTIELSHENPLGDGYFYAMLELPAAEHEIRDAIQRARMVGREESFRSIGILDCGAWPELLYYRLDSPSIDELNFFANRIAQMDDSELAIFRTVAPKVLGSPADDLLSMKDLINCTYGYDEIMVASNIRTDEQLGQFIIENELHDDVNNIPESSLYLLDKAKIGALYRTSLNCDLTDGYAIFAGDYKPPEIYDGKQLPKLRWKIGMPSAYRFHLLPLRMCPRSRTKRYGSPSRWQGKRPTVLPVSWVSAASKNACTWTSSPPCRRSLPISSAICGSSIS